MAAPAAPRFQSNSLRTDAFVGKPGNAIALNFSDVPRGQEVFVRCVNPGAAAVTATTERFTIDLNRWADATPAGAGTLSLMEVAFEGTSSTPPFVQMQFSVPEHDVQTFTNSNLMRTNSLVLIDRGLGGTTVNRFFYAVPRCIVHDPRGFRPRTLGIAFTDDQGAPFFFEVAHVLLLISPP